MSNWSIEPTVFISLDEIKEAMELGFLNYDKDGALPNHDDGFFGYGKKGNTFPTLFYGGGEDDRPNHQPMYDIDEIYRWGSGYESLLHNSKTWIERRKVYNLKPCPFCGNTNVKMVESEHKLYYVLCSAVRHGCGARSGAGTNKEVMTTKWNRREFAR